MLVAIYRMLLDGAHFADLGPDHFDERRKESLVRNSVRKLQELGFKVTLEEAA
jgi:hypothetical protein